MFPLSHDDICAQIRSMEGPSTLDRVRRDQQLVEQWTKVQNQIAHSVILEDDNEWSRFFSMQFNSDRDLFIAGADVSFSTSEKDVAIGSFTVVALRTDGNVNLVYSKSRKVRMPFPYIPTFLGFREAPVVSEMLRDLPDLVRKRIDCLLLDGNGFLHPRKAGFACQVGVEYNLPTIGVSKALLCVDGLIEKTVRQLATAGGRDGVDVVGVSGTVWARALITGNAKNKPIYVSVGHRVSLNTAARLVRQLCEYRVPAPIRAADLHSRALLRGEDFSVYESQDFLYKALPTRQD